MGDLAITGKFHTSMSWMKKLKKKTHGNGCKFVVVTILLLSLAISCRLNFCTLSVNEIINP